ncbi:LamG-like jellyroll fold domain-containing protein [Streptomyces jeddahensis]|uniref:tRNA(Glu)-specific nuclease WapA n=1 Tax=Streptomyces jeddahensis TaxID=1716141 RepID=A0A177HTE0_9ACTN|nr:LamG-like jellyroll fold domain-containing protein [Streptomyces jeddahensis]OAH14145.1 tRNA(Glu)-specific nuclease WapA precursor [Streptomyces jeddahensis]
MRRGIAFLVLTALAVMLTTQQAMAQGAELDAISLPSLTSLSSWFKDPRWGKLPHQQSGTAAGHKHHVSAKATEAHRGRGHAPGKGRGELAAYHAHKPAVARGKSQGAAGFNAKTSKRNAAKSSRTDTVFDNADGSTTRDISPTPVNYQVRKGKWAPIDVDVRAGPDGRWHEKANSLAVDFARKADDSALASFAVDGKHSLAYGLKGAASVKGTADGSTVTYRNVLDSTDLQLTPIATGLKEAIVLHSADAGNTWTFPLALKGLTPVLTKNGSVALRNAAGKTVERIPAAYAYDSKVNRRSGEPATTYDVTYKLLHTKSGYALKVTLDDSWLHDPRRVFPVTVDPTVDDGWLTTYVESPDVQDHSFEQTIKAGSYDSGTHKAIGFSNHWDTAWDSSNATVTEAHLDIFDTWASTCTPERFDVALVTQSWTPESVTTYPGPSHGSSIGNVTPNVPNACANTAADRQVGDWVQVPLSTSAIQGWFSGTTPDYGLAVYAATTDSLHWKQFGSFNDPADGPHILVTYTGNTAPQLYEQFPSDNAVVNTTQPELTAWAGGANSTSGSTDQYVFKVYDSTGTKVADSGLLSTGDWTVPAGKLAWNKNYTWTVQAYDGGLYSPADPYAMSVQVPQPVITSGLSQNSSDHGFDASIGNYTTSDTDASISTVGPSLDVERDYNSRDPRWTGAFGAGWSSIFDSRATEQYTASGAVSSVYVTYPDGSQVGYGKNSDGTFTPGNGRFATFKSITGGYSLTDKDDTVYTFTQSLGSGGYGLTSVTDANGRSINLTWTSGHVTKMASAVSSRSLNLTWSTPSGASAAHVATVVTDPVTPGNSSTVQTWTYGYTGDQLTKVCSPLSTTACTTYGYTSGSQYNNAALDLDPHTFWPLSETSGTTAKDSVLANEGTTNATYENVTLGQTGPLTGSSAKAAGFNGTSSDISLPKNLGNDTDSGAISLWFKTSAGPGVLYSYASQPISSGQAAGFYTPSIYVGTDGKLNAEFWYSGGINPIVSSASVADGRWHHVVLSAAGNSQSLYLDNVKVGSRTGTVSIKSADAFGKNQSFNYLGTGFLGGNWPDEPHQSSTAPDGYPTWFNGSIADVAWYGRPLVAADVNSLYQYGTHSASLLTSIKRPSGKTYAAMTYDAATTTLTQLTDENGGVWKLAAPTVSGSSQTYRGAVLGAAPSAYFRLGEAAGASTAVDEVRGGSGTYNGVTLGVSGPFSDQKAASFGGSSSSVTLPSGLVPGSGNESVSMWFKTSTANGVLFSASHDPLSSGTTPTSYTPVLYVGSTGKLYGEFWFSGGSDNPLASSTTVTDGKWHHVVLSASAGTQSLYLDDALVGSQSGTAAMTNQPYTYVGAGFLGGNWPDESHHSTTDNTGYATYFNGSIAETAFYRSQLSAADVSEQWDAAKNSTGLLPVETVKVTSPTNATLTYTYDVTNGNRALTETDGLGNKTSFGYDTGGFEHTVTDPNGAMTITGHDVRGNVVSSTSCQDQAANKCSTEYYTYYPDDTTAQLTTADPRNDQLLTERDGRSASATDTTYLTSYTYDSAGNQTAITGPAVPGFPNGRTTTTVYSDGTSAYPSADGGVVPKGLPVKTISPGGAVNTVSYFKNGDVASTTDAIGLVTSYTYDGLGQVLSQKVVSDTYPNGLTTTYKYDAGGQVVEEHDPQLTDRVTGATHAAVTTTVYDDDGDVTSQSVSDASGGDQARTETTTYDAYDHVLTQSDANAAEGASNGNTTTYTYDTSGNKTKEVTSAGVETRYTYDDNGNLLTQGLMYTGDPVAPQTATLLIESSRAYDPAGRLASVTDAMGNTTSYTYTDDGLTASVKRTSADGTSTYVLESDTYDAAGNLLSSTTDNGETVTNYKVDAASRTTSTTVDPTGVDRVTTVSYTPDDEIATENDHDSSGYDRTTTNTYDDMGNLLSETLYGDASGHPAGWWKLNQTSGTNVTDASGTGNTATAGSGVTWADDAAKFNGSSTGTGDVIATSSPVLDTTASYTVSAWVNLADTSTYRTFVAQGGTNRASFYLQYSKADNAFRFHAASSDATSPSAFYDATASSAPTLNTWTHLVGVFDATTGSMKLYVNGAQAGSATDTSPWTGTGPLSIGGTKTAGGTTSDVVNGEVDNVQTYQRALTASEVSSLYGKGRSGGTVGSSDEQKTTYTYDKRGLPTSMTDAEHNTTTYAYDEAGNLAVTTAPAVQAEADGTNPATVHPVTTSGFNTFGEAVEEQDPNGLVTTTAYDADGNKVSETLPSYTPAGASSPNAGTTVWTYDSEGNQTSETTPGGKTTSYLYDQMGNVAQITAPDGTKTHATYDTNGDQLSATDATGAASQATYDFLGRQLTSTTLERYPSTKTLTTTNSYAVTTGNPYGAHVASTTTPGGVTTSYGYNRAGDVTSVTDGAGNTTRYTYDFMGNQQKTILPDNTWIETDYNASDDPVTTKQYDANNNLLTQTSQTYDGVGNLTSATDARGHTTRWTYDAAGTITQEVEPVDASTSITTTFGYDAAGNRTRFTDGRGNSWRYTYTPWGQQEKVIEPTTSTYSSTADSTTTFAYDADGQPTTVTQPGGVTTTMTYDANGQLKTMSGSGAEAATAKRSFSYDADGRVLSADTDVAGTAGQADYQAATHDAFTYDDRGDVLTATGAAGSSSFTYNDDGSMLTRTDAAGTTSYGYDTAGRLSSLNDAATGTQLTYTYDQLNDLKTVKYGSTGQTRTFSYDSAHELTGDVLVQGASTLASFAYGYDENGNLTSKTTTGVSGASANTYTYDWSDRLTSWNNGSTTTQYAYDASGNRIRVGSDVYTYDARDELTSDGTNTYAYSARGTMTQESSSGGSVAYKTDAFGDQIVAGTQSYTLDALGRNITDTDTGAQSTRTFAYSGADNTIASDGDNTYTYDPAGGVIGIKPSGGTAALALTDQHNDVVGTFTSGATGLSGSASYDPLGKVISTSSMTGHLGFQSGWTEPGTGDVGTASRWYNPDTGQFLNKDSVSLDAVPNSVAANPFAYVDDNPMAGTDESGNCSWYDVVCGAKKVAHKVSHAVKHVAHKVYHAVKHVAHRVVHAVKHAAHKIAHHVRDVYRATVRVTRRVYHYASRHVRRAYHAAVHAVHSAYHKVSHVVHRVVHAVKHVAHKVVHGVKKAAHAVAHAARTAYHATVSAAKTAAKFVKHHAAAITSFVVSTAVFAGCEAATWGVGTIGCAALAGAAGSLVEQGFKCAQDGGDDCSVGAFAGSAVEGAVVGAAGGKLGELGGKLLAKVAPKAMKAVGGLFGKGATDAGESAAADATDEAASAAESEGAGTRSQSHSGDEGGSCPVPTHSFTGQTRVLMADGTTKAIEKVRVGDMIANSVPGVAGTEAHKVTGVIVTYTDHDFVDLTIKKTAESGTESAARAGVKAGAKSLAKKVARKAAFGLAASAAVLGALGASGHGHGDGQEPATAPVAAVSTASAGQDAKAAGTSGGEVEGARLTTTFHHPFYDETQTAFVEAKDLRTGDVLQTPTGTAEVTGVRLYHRNTTTYDLTIGSLHTYYVEAGDTPVLVHNCNGTSPRFEVDSQGETTDLRPEAGTRGKVGKDRTPVPLIRSGVPRGPWTLSERLSEAQGMLSDAVESVTGKLKDRTWVGAVNTRTGEAAVTCSGLGSCAEPNILVGTGWKAGETIFTRAFAREDLKDGLGKIWRDKEVCTTCQGMFPEENFVDGVLR